MKVKLKDVCELVAGYAFKSRDFGNFPDKIIKITQIDPPYVDLNGALGINLLNYSKDKLKKYLVKKGDFVFAMTGATIGKIGRLLVGEAYLNQRVLLFKPSETIDKDYLYYVLRSYEFSQYVNNHIDSESAQPNISATTVGNYEFDLCPFEQQVKIGSILRTLDLKIENNNEINDNLSKQAMAIYREMFTSRNFSVKPLDELFNISIGKTPPRKEFEWFSNDEGIKWVSISNLGSCGTYISQTSERLTEEAVKKFNIPVLEPNTVLLSFKLTVGRVAITDGLMCTNEAIASFNKEKLPLTLYLFCFLKDFKFQTLGSTSSIATAVNSKIIKKIPLPVPPQNELETFNALVSPLFDQIRYLERENMHLSEIRDILMPKLLKGEL